MENLETQMTVEQLIRLDDLILEVQNLKGEDHEKIDEWDVAFKICQCCTTKEEVQEAMRRCGLTVRKDYIDY